MSKERKELLTNNELAESRTHLAKERNSLAESRTLQAAERTYVAWVRTGFTIAGAGWTMGTALRNTEGSTLGLFIGGILMFLGMISFIYAWISYKAIYDYLKGDLADAVERNYPSNLNLITVTITSTTLVLVFIIGFVFLLMN